MSKITYTGRGPNANAVQCDYGDCERTAKVSVSALIQGERDGRRTLSAIFQVCKRHESSTRNLLEELHAARGK